MITQAVEDMPFIDIKELEGIPPDVLIQRVYNSDLFSVRERKKKAEHTPKVNNHSTAKHSEANRNQFLTSQKDFLAGMVKYSGSIMLKWILENMSYHPDALRPWANEVIKFVVKESFEKFEAVMTSSPAYSCHVAGYKIKKKKGIPWVADFRDLWVGRPFREYKSRWHQMIDERLEAKVVHNADKIILASPAWIDVFVRRYGEEIDSKLCIITNGFEQQRIDEIRSKIKKKPKRKKFVLTGSMHNAESPIPFLKAIGILHERNPERIKDLEAVFIGNAGSHLAELKELIRCYKIKDKITFLTPRSNEECIKEQLEADYLVMFSNVGHEDTIRGKSFEYMASGKPILACIPEGIQADILRKAGNAIIVEHGDIEGTIEGIMALIRDENLSSLKPNWEYIKQFDRRILTQKLVNILEEVSGA